MPTLDTIDLLSDLLASEQASAFHFMAQGDPYIHRSAAEFRRPLEEMIRAAIRREGELSQLLWEMGSTPAPQKISLEHQYMAYLAIDFLLPKLIDDKRQSIERYVKSLALLGPHQELPTQVLQGQLSELRAELSLLEQELQRLQGAKPGSTTAMHDVQKQ